MPDSGLTVADLRQMGFTDEEIEQALLEGVDPNMFNSGGYDALGIMSPPDIGGQAQQWVEKDAYEAALESTRPYSRYEQQQNTRFAMPNEDAFPYDIAIQANPYLRGLLTEAISKSKPGPNQPFDVENFVFGKMEGGKSKGNSRIGRAATEVLNKQGEFEKIAEQFHSDDPNWATRDRGKQRQLLTAWLKEEASANLEGGAPSISRNQNFADWQAQRTTGEPFQFSGPGFERPGAMGSGAPRVQMDPAYFGKNVTEGTQAQMSLSDFKRAYGDALASDFDPARPQEGRQIDAPELGGYWVTVANRAQSTPLEQRRRELEAEDVNKRQQRFRQADKGKSKKNEPWWKKFGGVLTGTPLPFGR